MSNKKQNAFQSKKLAKAILDKRTKENLSFRDIQASTKGDLPIGTLYKLEAGTINPTADLLARVCNWLQADVQTFF